MKKCDEYYNPKQLKEYEKSIIFILAKRIGKTTLKRVNENEKT